MPKRKHSPSPTIKRQATPDDNVKQEMVPSDDELETPERSDSDAERKPQRRKTKTSTQAGGKKRGRKPGVSYASKKWSGAELRQLFLLGLGSGESGSVPIARFEGMPDRSVSQCKNAWR